MKEFDFQNPWDVDGKYYVSNATSSNVLERELNTSKESEKLGIIPTGSMSFEGLNETELMMFAIIDEEGGTTHNLRENGAYDGDGFFYKHFTENEYWYKVSGESSVTVTVKQDRSGFIWTPTISAFWKTIAEKFGKYYNVDWEPKSSPRPALNPFDRNGGK